VSQVFCAAAKVITSLSSRSEWEPFARLILEATYEAALWAAVVNMRDAAAEAEAGGTVVPAGSHKVILTLVGGGVFGNELEWIVDAVNRAIAMVAASAPPGGWGLEVCLAHFKEINPALERAVFLGAPLGMWGQEWACSACTCLNSDLANTCRACNAKRPQADAAAGSGSS